MLTITHRGWWMCVASSASLESEATVPTPGSFPERPLTLLKLGITFARMCGVSKSSSLPDAKHLDEFRIIRKSLQRAAQHRSHVQDQIHAVRRELQLLRSA